MSELTQILSEIKKQRIKIYKILDIDLSVAKTNFEYLDVGTYVYVLNNSGVAYIRFNELSEDTLSLLKFRAIKIPFYRFYITNTAQAGCSISLAIGVQSEYFDISDLGSTIAGGIITEATSPTLYNDVCTVAATEYSRSLGECRKFLIKARGGQVKVCFTSGQSGTNYILLNDNQAYNEDLIHPTALILYFQSPTAGAIVEIVKWL